MRSLDFLALFDGNICYAAIDDKRDNQHPDHYHEGFDLERSQILDALGRKNTAKSGNGIFFCVNEIDRDLDMRITPNGGRKQRTSRMVVKCRAVFIDDDVIRDEPRSEFPLEPSIIVNSSPGKYHYYWLTETDNTDEWQRVMNTVVVELEGDPKARDLVRVMRLPGFYHRKGDPFRTKVVGGNSKKYDWNLIRDTWEPSDEMPVTATSADGTTRTVRVDNYKTARELVKTGENYHDALRYLGLHYVNLGLPVDEVLGTLQDLMETCYNQDERWQQRCQQLETNLKDWFEFVEENPLDFDEFEVNETTEDQVELDWPPGLMGDLCREIYEMAHHPNQELAIVAGFTLVAGVVGRTFNVNGSGLNLYIACLGRTGIGKSIIKDSINKALREIGSMNNGQSFIGPSRITGPKALLKALHEHPSKLLIMEESGLLSASSAGDTAGINRVMLELFTSSGKDQWFGAEAYSDSKEGSAALRAPSLTVAHVSTPDSYIEALKSKDSANSGDLARMWTLRTLRDKSYLNNDVRSNFSDGVAQQIKNVIGACSANQKQENKDKPIVIDMDTSNIDLIQLDMDWTDRENELIHTDPLKATIASRAVLKIIKIASVISVFNDTGGKVGFKEFEWAQRAVEAEFDAINTAVKLNDVSEVDTIIEFVATPAILKIVSGGYKDKKKRPSAVMMKKGIFSRSHFHQALKGNATIKKMDSDIQRSNGINKGTYKLLEDMVKSGLIIKLSKHNAAMFSKGGKAVDMFQVTQDLVDLNKFTDSGIEKA